MLDLLSYIIKIAISVALSYLCLYYSNTSKKEIFSKILVFNFLSVSFLSPIYTLSINNESMILYSISILILFISGFLFSKMIDKEYYPILFLVFIISILMSASYIVYSSLIILLYLYLNNYLLPIINEDREDKKED